MEFPLTMLQASWCLATVGLTVITAAGFFGSISGWLDYAAHFRPHLAIAALIAIAGALLVFPAQRSLLPASWAALVFVVNAAVILGESRFRAPAATAADSDTWTVASINLNFLNREFGRVESWIRAEQPDVMVITEVDQPWLGTLERLADLYPYRAIGRTNFVTMLSRRPWTSLEVAAGPRARQGILVARFATVGKVLTVIGAHPASPVNPRWVPSRDAELAAIGRLAAAAPGPVAAMGDFNATPWSAPMRRLVRSSPLRYADLAVTTWPTFVPRWLGIKIDHIMLGKGCKVVGFRVGPDIGSDHRPVLAVIRLP
jgi:endonuclease/exonuclease/phosphatase (EEP) superfamily protein YafD